MSQEEEEKGIYTSLLRTNMWLEYGWLSIFNSKMPLEHYLLPSGRRKRALSGTNSLPDTDEDRAGARLNNLVGKESRHIQELVQ